MSIIQLAQISIYPIKSTAGIELSSSWVDDLGLIFDRRFVLTDNKGQFITARTDAKLCLIQANLTATGLILTAPDMPKLVINYQDLTQQYQSVAVWQDSVNAQLGSKPHHLWFSRYLNKPCQLLYFGEQSARIVPKASKRTNQLAFADGYPLLLISQASLNDLNQRAKNNFTMKQFRPNIVVDHCHAFAEDSWSHIRIGEVEFKVKKPCSRCTFTTIDPLTAEKHLLHEPLKTLKTYRQSINDEGQAEVLFGQNLVPLNQGQINVSDRVTVLQKKSSPVFIASAAKKPTSVEKSALALKPTPTSSSVSKHQFAINKKISITFSAKGKTLTGNSKSTLLEQGEDAGLILPHSCRGGMCGRCKVKLESGEVEQLSVDGLTDEEQEQGYILTCSSIPKTDVVLG